MRSPAFQGRIGKARLRVNVEPLGLSRVEGKPRSLGREVERFTVLLGSYLGVGVIRIRGRLQNFGDRLQRSFDL